MTIEKIGNAFYIDGDDAVQDAVFYSNLLKNPEVGITARQMKAILEGKSVSIKLQAESNTSLEELQRKINEIERRTKQYTPTQSVLLELIQLKDELKIRKEKDGSAI